MGGIIQQFVSFIPFFCNTASVIFFLLWIAIFQGKLFTIKVCYTNGGIVSDS